MLTCTAFASLLLRSWFSFLSLGCLWKLVPEAWTNFCHKQRWRRSADQRSKESQDSAVKSPLQVCYFYEDLHKHNWWSTSPLRAELELSKFFREPWPHIKAFMLKLYSRFSFSSNVNWSFDFFFLLHLLHGLYRDLRHRCHVIIDFYSFGWVFMEWMRCRFDLFIVLVYRFYHLFKLYKVKRNFEWLTKGLSISLRMLLSQLLRFTSTGSN